MKLTDGEILELDRLCSGWVDETLEAADRAKLAEWLLQSEAARRYYVQATGLSASLCHYAGEMQFEAPERIPLQDTPWLSRAGWALGGLAAAAVLAGLLWLRPAGNFAEEATRVAKNDFSARLTGSNQTVWAPGSRSIKLGDHLRAGQRLDLQSGFAEVTFDSGAQIILQGPASLDINSPWDSSLRQGALKAYVPPEAIGFRVSHPSVEIVDLGTEFTMVADASGSAKVLVLKGEVEAAPRSPNEQDSILLKAKEGRNFARSGVTELAAGDNTFAGVASTVAMQRFAPTVHYIHWSLDRLENGVLPAQAVGEIRGSYDLKLQGVEPGGSPVADLGAGRRGLKLNGRYFGHAAVPGLSGAGAHTLALWARVPVSAPLNSSYAMVAWSARAKKLSSRPVQISWNRTPGEGPVGALRTDFGGGSALGTTSLRDGRWHHIAVVFSPGDEGAPVQVRQYVDGKLESSTTNPPRRAAALGGSKSETRADLKDSIWIGCRLGTTGYKQERFQGDIDELFIANWGLEPNEIIGVMNDNRITPPGAVVAAR
jgi:hypothetical protein